ncbi:MAG: hypothetical protein OIN66_11335 [Candidatus Methanoperedens sp.]|nr:hypothetical protein [Candidatus Methanoperedens sp.]
MDDYKLTEKELLVLNYFIDNESKVILERNPIEEHFNVYPGKIETELGGKISRVYAKEVCEKYTTMGILSKSGTDSSKKESEKSYYFMNYDLIAFKQVVRLILENLEKKTAVERFGRAYFQSKIDEKTVKKVLFERGVVLRRKLEISNWEELEAKKLFNDIPRTINILMGESIDNLPDSDIRSFDVYMQRKLERLDSEEKIINQFYPFEIYIDLPVLDLYDGRTVEGYVEKIEVLNEKLFESCPSLKKCLSGIEEHYNIWQEKNLITPILILIKISPSALGEFLYGNWTFEEKTPCEDVLTGHFEKIMEKLLFLTISDLALTGSYPKNDLINDAHIRPIVTKITGKEKEELLSCTYDGHSKIIYFDKRFLITSSIDNKEPEKLGLTIVDRGHTYSPDILRKYNDFVENIKNFSEILNYLKNREKPISRILYKHFSILAKNLLTYCNPLENIPLALEKKLKYEIFEALTKEDWNELLFIAAEELSDLSKKELEQHLKLIDTSKPKFDLANIHFRIKISQTILKDVFRNAFYPELRDDSYCNNKKTKGGGSGE